jgi:hypothetical protein
MRHLPVVVVGILLLGAIGCSSSPAAPTPSSEDISGTWSGSILTTNGLNTISMTFAESGASLSGSWSSLFPSNTAVNSGGQLTGSKNGANVAVTLTPSNPLNCPYTFNATVGTLTSMAGTFAAFNCTVSSSGQLTLTKS